MNIFLNRYLQGKVELDLSNYATKSDLTNTEGVDSSKFTKKFD